MCKAYVLLSGGMDSATCLYLAAKEYGPSNVMAITVGYGQRHSKEMGVAIRLATDIGACVMKISLGAQPASMLTERSAEIPDISYDDIEGVSPTYVHFRNGQLISAITAYASADKEAEVIYFGAHSEDAANWAYPDCTPEFIGAMANAIFIGTYKQIRLVAPLTYLDKVGIVKLGTELGVPFANTWSCYKGEAEHCGTCPTCRSRREAFIKANISDPTIYAELPGGGNEI